jgi:hypothetical protein
MRLTSHEILILWSTPVSYSNTPSSMTYVGRGAGSDSQIMTARRNRSCPSPISFPCRPRLLLLTVASLLLSSCCITITAASFVPTRVSLPNLDTTGRFGATTATATRSTSTSTSQRTRATTGMSATTTTTSAATVSITDAFDGGNIKFVAQEGSTVVLEIKPDPFTELERKTHLQYFCFRAILSNGNNDNNNNSNGSSNGNSNEPLTYVISNANQASFPEAWTGTTIFFAPTLNDPNAWKRVASTTYCQETGQLSWTYTQQSGFFTYFPP